MKCGKGLLHSCTQNPGESDDGSLGYEYACCACAEAASAGDAAFPQLVDWQHSFAAGRPVLPRGAAMAGVATDGIEPRAGHGHDGGGDSARGIDAGRRGSDGPIVGALCADLYDDRANVS